MITKDIAKLLDLSPKEIKIMDCLENNPLLSITEISHISKVPRMTVNDTVRKLMRREIIACNKKGRRLIYSLNMEKLNLFNLSFNNDGIQSMVGVESLFSLWTEIKELPKDSRVLGIQPTGSMHEVMNKFKWNDRLMKIQEEIVKKPIIIEALLPTDYYPSIFKYYKKLKGQEFARKVIKSFIGRATDMTFIEKEVLDFKSELIILPEVAFIVNWKDEVGIRITNREIINLLKRLFESVRDYGKRVNQNDYLKELLEMAQ